MLTVRIRVNKGVGQQGLGLPFRVEVSGSGLGFRIRVKEMSYG